jgi:hypothetical protein
MNGTGSTITFDGESFSVDSTKLATATNTFVSHLGTVSGEGERVVVGGVEFGVDSAKVADAVSELESVLDGMNSGGSGLVMNEYGFYFDVPYVNATNNTKVTTMWYADGSAYIKEETDGRIISEQITEPSTYLYDMNQITLYDNIYIFSDNGTKIMTNNGEATLTLPNRSNAPIVEYNALDVVGNTTVTLEVGSFKEPYPLVKVSNETPTVVDMARTFYSLDNIVIPITTPTLLGNAGEGHAYFDDNSFTMMIVINSANAVFGANIIPDLPLSHDVVFAETGIYFADFGGAEGRNLNIRLGWLPSHGNTYDDTYPIEWNTLNAATNSGADIDGRRFIKISNLLLSAEELNKTTIIARENSQEFILAPVTEANSLPNGISRVPLGNENFGPGLVLITIP